jgi:cytochrome d ubiquinol oxidase subunit II
VGIIFRGVSIEFRNKENKPGWHKFWDTMLSVASIIVLLVLGVAVGNFIQGLPVDANGDIHINLLQLFTPLTLVIGLQSVFFFAMHGSLYAAMKATGDTHDTLLKKAKLFACVAGLLFILSFFVVGNYSAFSVIANIVIILAFVWILVLLAKNKAGVALLTSGIIAALYITSIAVMVFPNFVVSTIDPAYSLSLYNCASSPKTLEIMLIIAGVGVPIMLAYTIFVYRVFKGKVNKNDSEAAY